MNLDDAAHYWVLRVRSARGQPLVAMPSVCVRVLWLGRGPWFSKVFLRMCSFSLPLADLNILLAVKIVVVLDVWTGFAFTAKTCDRSVVRFT